MSYLLLRRDNINTENNKKTSVLISGGMDEVVNFFECGHIWSLCTPLVGIEA